MRLVDSVMVGLGRSCHSLLRKLDKPPKAESGDGNTPWRSQTGR
jgi:hypothetical protein